MRTLIAVLLLLIGCQTAEAPLPTATPTVTPSTTPQIGIEFATLAPPTMAIVQITPSPPPTATPTPTATPIIYAIRGGDTLWSIALQNRTLPETIEALNPNLRPESLQIGQEIVLPPQPTALAAEAVGTPIPIEIVVNSVTFYRSPIGGGWILGEIENVGPFSAENITVQIGMLDEDDQLLGEIVARPAAPLLPPRSKAPFAAQVNRVTTDPAALNASIVAGQTVVTLGARYLDLRPVEATLQTQDARIQITTTISNSGMLTPTSLTLVTTLYDTMGNVNGMTQHEITTPLAGGALMPFSAELIPLSPTTRDFALLVYGRVEQP